MLSFSVRSKYVENERQTMVKTVEGICTPVLSFKLLTLTTRSVRLGNSSLLEENLCLQVSPLCHTVAEKTCPVGFTLSPPSSRAKADGHCNISILNGGKMDTSRKCGAA